MVAIQTSGSLEVLTHHNQGVVSKLDLPTWCPDWTIMRGKRIRLWPNEYSAAGSFVKTEADLSDNSLTIRGVEVDRIKYLKAFVSDDFKIKTYIHKELHSFVQMACQAPFPEPSPPNRLDTTRRTLVAGRIRPGGPREKAVVLQSGSAHHFWDAWSEESDDSPLSQHEKDAQIYADALYSVLSGRSVLLTDRGRVGLVDGSVHVGDLTYVFIGGQVPFCIRSRTQLGDQTYELVGEWYVQADTTARYVSAVNVS